MLEHWRQQRAREAASHWPRKYEQVFFDQEVAIQIALAQLGATVDDPPSQILKVGRMFMNVSDAMTLRRPYAVEVVGPPGAGKDTMINRYLESLWLRNIRHQVTLVDEGARSVKHRYGHLRTEDPLTYTLLGGTQTFMDYIDSTTKVNSGAHMSIANRGQIDRRVFRRALFGQGHVNPEIMMNEDEFIYGLENTPIQVCGIISLLIRPEMSFYSRGGDGSSRPVRNLDTLSRLYEQYLRLHHEVLAGNVPFRFYQCIDAEAPLDEVYEHFAYTMDSALTIHDKLAHAVANVFPKEFDQMQAQARAGVRIETPAEKLWGKRLGGKKVLIVGGDDMHPDEDFSGRPFVEATFLR